MLFAGGGDLNTFVPHCSFELIHVPSVLHLTNAPIRTS